jgi:hypothetical protein
MGLMHARVAKLDVGARAIARAKALLRDAPKRVRRHRATIGIQEEQGGRPKLNYAGVPGEATLAEVMRAHEFGTDILPERSWLRGWFDPNRDRLFEGMKEAMQAEFRGDGEAVLEWVRQTTEEWRGWLAAGGDFVGLTPATIAVKEAFGLPASDTPLVATKQFLASFSGGLDGEPT